MDEPIQDGGKAPAKRRVLAVDDDEGLREIFSLTMSMGGFEVACAPDGLSALAVMEQFKPDFIALDLMMPRMNGLQFCGKLTESGVRIPIIIVSACWEKFDMDLLRQDVNIVGFLHKPLRYPTLIDSINKILPP
ncbi:MAG: response regulator [Elusimicrobiota bacterium]